MKMFSDVQNRVGTPHIKMCLPVHTRVGTPHMPIGVFDQMFKLGGGGQRTISKMFETTKKHKLSLAIHNHFLEEWQLNYLVSSGRIGNSFANHEEKVDLISITIYILRREITPPLTWQLVGFCHQRT